MAEILIADDDPILVEILKFRLEGAGHSVSVAKDGEEALAMVQSGAPQLIVLDSMMPILSGPEVLAQLKSDEALRDIPVVMLTARDSEADIVAGLKGGAAEYLTKPFSKDELLNTIRQYVPQAEQ